MRAFNFITALTAAALLTCGTLTAQDAPYDEQFRYIEVTGTSEVEIIPDEIHFVIGIKEYFEEEFDGKSKPEDYRTKVRIETIESQMRKALHSIGITDSDIRTQDVGDYWRERGLDFLIGKNLDITLHDFTMIDKIISVIDTKGVSSMRIGEMTHKDILKYQEQGKKDAVLAARRKAEYMAGALGEQLGSVLSIKAASSGWTVPHTAQPKPHRQPPPPMPSAPSSTPTRSPAASPSKAGNHTRRQMPHNSLN